MNKTNVITIEKNVPIPELSWSCDTTKYNFMDNLELADSFYINGNTPDFSPVSVRSYVYGLNSKTDRKYTIRTIEGRSKNPISIRVWRTK
tara:strand:- start:1647 stop:1916 length:270 start_codon:yes stop_codon:yes gene_type:complete